MSGLLTDRFFAHAQRRPRTPAVCVQGQRWSYGELAAGVAAAARELDRRLDGALVGARVAVSSPPGVGFLEVALGAAAVGAQAVVCDPAWSAAELDAALEDAAPALLITEGQWRAAEPGERDGRDRWVHPPAPSVDETAPFYVGFTSGTTGRPRGFVRSHRSWMRSVDACEEAFGSAAGEHVLVPGSLAHSLSFFAAVHALSVGACVHLLPRFRAHTALRVLRDEPVTRLWTVPSMTAGILRVAERAGAAEPIRGVRSVLSSGSTWSPELASRTRALFPTATLTDFYGASELSFVSACHEPDQAPASCIGQPLPGVEAVVRGHDGVERGPGEPGRLWVRSPYVFSGYLGEPPPGEWITVGDVVQWDEHGRLHRLGREDDLVTTGGVTVAPEEVEAALRGLREVADVAVVGLEHPERGAVLAAVIQCEDDAELTLSALRRHCRATLAPPKRPRVFFVTSALPVTAAGKVARARLRADLRAGTADVEELT